MSIPIATSPGRNGFGPQLTLSYDSGSGNSAFGFGWSLSLPSITRKTDKGLPRYRDDLESDVFILSGAEDLVPQFRKSAAGEWARDAQGQLVIHEDLRDGYVVRRYRPRVEGLFARIERWTHGTSGDVHWRSISRDNVTTLYGKTTESRVADPSDASRVFSWLICATYDDRGNASSYEYRNETSDGVDEKFWANERNRSLDTRKANTYLKSIKYGNENPNRDANWKATDPASTTDWLFEVVFDYDEGRVQDSAVDAQARQFVRAWKDPQRPWALRLDPFSAYRSGFEVRTYRLCRRVLMFHHFPAELGTADYLIRSTDFEYSESPIASFITGVTQSGYVRQPDGTYLKRSMPRLEFGYSAAKIDDRVRLIDAKELENLPIGVGGAAYQWVDLDGEGSSGILTENAEGWLYKRNLSANALVREDGRERARPRFGSLERVATRPSASLARTQLLDLAGDGQVDLVDFGDPVAGFYERTADGWTNLREFGSRLTLDVRDPNVKFIDLDGDGHADVLVTEDDALTWHPSRGEDGFGPAERAPKRGDEEDGPRVVFADASESVYLADLSGDGLTDLVRIRNGDMCYWPNLGYGRFGRKVTMDAAPWFDNPDQFDQGRLRLADIDGSGPTDLIYLGPHGAVVYRNYSGNSWGRAENLPEFPTLDDVSDVAATDLLGNGTACLVWSSPLPAEASSPMRYVDLMGGQKPHLLISMRNNLGAETIVTYAPSTKFYLADREAGRPWVTKLSFPVHVVERIDTYDRISRNLFVTRYAYHHGYFDGGEREFRGFGMVEQWDTAEMTAVGGQLPSGDNFDERSHVPPVLTKTWFHTGAYLAGHVSDFYAGLDAGGAGEYYREPGLSSLEARELLLEDTVLPPVLTLEEEREACRALKGSMLRQEVYAADGTDAEPRPYSVTEQNFTIRLLQPRERQRHAVFLSHARESLSFQYERVLAPVLNGKIVDEAAAAANPSVKWLPDPRLSHVLTLETDDSANVLKSATVAYGRRFDDLRLPSDLDRSKQRRTLVTYSENEVTTPVDDAYDHRAPTLCDARTYELTGYSWTGGRGRFAFEDFVASDAQRPGRLVHVFDSELPYEQSPTTGKQRRLIEHVRTLFRPSDLGAAQSDSLALLPLRQMGALAVPGETFELASTPGLIGLVFKRPRPGQADEDLLPNTSAVLGAGGANGGGYRRSQDLRTAGVFPASDPDDHWWIPSGRIFYSPDRADSAAEELVEARGHFFMSRRYRDPFDTGLAFNTETIATYDDHDLLLVDTRDPLANRVTVGERDPTGTTATNGNDYRVLQPAVVMDPNRNRAAARFDAFGLVVGTAVMGKPELAEGDSLAGFVSDLPESQNADPFADPAAVLSRATTRLVYDHGAYTRTRATATPQPAAVYSLARETHDADPVPAAGLRIQQSVSYSDGFGREIQKKLRAEPGPVPRRDAAGAIIVGPDGQPAMTPDDGPVRWVGSGWTVFNNKGKAVRQYEPFFTDRRQFEFDVRIGVSPIVFYDPPERVVATLHPNHTWQAVIFDAWRQATWDVNDTVLHAPTALTATRGFFLRADGTDRLPRAEYSPSWHGLRTSVANAASAALLWPDLRDRDAEKASAERAAVHAATPTVAHFDALGRTVVTVAQMKVAYSAPPPPNTAIEEFQVTRVDLDIEGNDREITDPEGRTVIRYAYDLLGNRILHASMDAGSRWMVSDVSGRVLCVWGPRPQRLRTSYDRLRRPVDSLVLDSGATEITVGHTTYGESRSNPEVSNVRGRAYQQFDQGGVLTYAAYDFKGNPRRRERAIARDYAVTLDWSQPVPLQATQLIELTRHDALNRTELVTAPDGSVVRASYNEASLIERIDANLRGNLVNGQAVWTPFVRDVDYNARGQRQLVEYGNSVRASYSYDPFTFRLARLMTQRGRSLFPDDCPDPADPGWPGCHVQDLHYVYDPAGNPIRIRDDAQQTIYFRNRRVDPNADYTYDALYRLIEATGREHLGQLGGTPVSHSYDDHSRVAIVFSANDGNAMGRYLEQYIYDSVGNFREVSHRGTDPVQAGWRRTYAYDEPSALGDGSLSNRLTSTTIDGGPAETYSVGGNGYDAHGNLLRMPHLQIAQWDFEDRLRMTVRQALGAGDDDGQQHHGERTWYVYAMDGERLRKVTESAGGSVREERVYFGVFEIYRRYGLSALERETLHVMDDKQRIALVETRTDAATVEQVIRYQFSNHLGSAVLELDGLARLISYEEYTPYGSTSCQAVSAQTETPKRYRYVSKERDDETGLYYYGARYYAPWLGRWLSCDPAGMYDGPNIYSFVRGNPVRLTDGQGEYSKETFKESFAAVSEVKAQGAPKKGQPDTILLQLREAQSIAHPNAAASALNATGANVGDKYLYTTHAGVVDVEHFFGTARFVYGRQVVEGQTDVKVKFLAEKERDEFRNRVGGYAADDLPSNALGALFAEHLTTLKDPQSVDVAKEAEKFLEKLGPLEQAELDKLMEDFSSRSFRSGNKAFSSEPVPIVDEIIEATGGEKSPYKSLQGKTGAELLREKGIELDPAITAKTVPDEDPKPIGLKFMGAPERVEKPKPQDAGVPVLQR